MEKIKAVEAYWDSNPCQASVYFGNIDKKSAFNEIERERYRVFWRIPEFADFPAFKGKKVLEIGCGIGTDGIQFARSGASYTGADLTDSGINIARERFALFSQQGDFVRINAEKLTFPDNYFDHVYSFGVIHHSVDPEKIVAEIYRVLKPGGSITIMLYNRTSFYYLIEVKIIRKIFFKLCGKKKLCRITFSLFNKNLFARFESYRKKLEEKKITNRRPSEQAWISMNTDDVLCPIARVYSRAEAEEIFARFRDFKTETWFIDKQNWFLWLAFGRFVPRHAVKWLESKSGWFRMVRAKK